MTVMSLCFLERDHSLSLPVEMFKFDIEAPISESSWGREGYVAGKEKSKHVGSK